MAKNNKICALCGSAYKYCGNCREDMQLPIWMNTFCSEECLNVYEAMVAFVNKRSSKEATKAVLMKYQESGKYQNYKKSFADTYNQIMTEEESDSKEENTQDKEQKNIIKTKEKIEEQMAVNTASQVKANIITEAKKTYPKAIAHKHGK